MAAGHVSALPISALVFCIVYGGAFLGVFLQSRLPKRLRDTHAKESVQAVTGLVATMAALVLGLLIASTHAGFLTQQAEVQKLARDVILLDEALARYGPETRELRRILREDVAAAIRAASPEEGVGSASVAPPGATAPNRHLFETIQALEPGTAAQRYDQAKAVDLMAAIAATRLMIHEQATGRVAAPLIVVMVSWLAFLFVGFGLFARANTTVLVALGCGALSVAAAIFLILDMSHPYRGLIHVSGAPIRGALQQLGR